MNGLFNLVVVRRGSSRERVLSHITGEYTESHHRVDDDALFVRLNVQTGICKIWTRGDEAEPIVDIAGARIVDVDEYGPRIDGFEIDSTGVAVPIRVILTREGAGW